MKYHIQEQIYESLHSHIYKGIREEDKKPVVLKELKSTLSPGSLPSPEEIARFEREYQITRKVGQGETGSFMKGIIQIYALERIENRLMIVLEDFGGESLLIQQERFSKNQGFKPDYFLSLAIKIGECLVFKRNLMCCGINPALSFVFPF